MKSFFQTCCMLLLTCTLFGQNLVTINGIVNDSDGNSLDNISIDITGWSNCGDTILINTVTNPNGWFSVELNPICETGFLYANADCDGNNIHAEIEWDITNGTTGITLNFICEDTDSTGCNSLQVVLNQDLTGGPLPSIIASVSGGTPPYTYFWDNGQFTANLNNVADGTYCITVTDAQGCTYTTCIFVNNNNGGGGTTCVDTTLISNVPCTTEYEPVCGCDGVTYGNTCEATNWGGVTSWTAGACVPDSTACYMQVILLQNQTNTGATIVVTVSGGTAPYAYLWNSGQNSPNLSNLADGIYCITVVDSEGCSVVQCIDIWNNNTDTLCNVWIDVFSLQDTINISTLIATAEGEAPFTYHWSTGEIGQSIDAFEDGYYCVTMADATGCTSVSCVDINNNIGGGDDCFDPSAINLGANCIEIYEPVCGCDGITYENSCIAEECFGIVEYEAGPCANGGNGGNQTDSLLCNVNFEYTIDSIGMNQVLVNFTATGSGTAPYTYEWFFGNVTDSLFFSESVSLSVTFQDSFYILPACVWITDATGCSAAVCETIIIDGSPNAFINGSITESDNLTSGSGVFHFSGIGDPLADVTVRLLSAQGELMETTLTNEVGFYAFTDLYFGNYYIQVAIDGIEHEPFPVKLSPTAQLLTALDFEVSKDGVETTNTTNLDGLAQVSLFPNPVQDQVNLQFTATEQAEVKLAVYDLNGRILYQNNLMTQLGTQTISIPTARLSTGVYLLSIHSDKGVISQRFVK